MDRLRIMFAALLALTPLGACTPDTPQTLLSWDVKDSLTAPAPKIAAAPRPLSHPVAELPKPRAIPPLQTARVETRALPAPAAAPATAAGTVAFAWPLNGRVISAFGASSGGERNDGINIAAIQGTPIHAAASGTVSYAGDDLKAYGNLLLIKHEDGYVTAYAHADRLIVGKGESVTKGQVIGYAGHTGDVATPQLHFEIRRGTQPLDPSALLEGRSS